MKIYKRSPNAFFLNGDERGLLLIHGFTGTAAEMGPMGEYFHARGYTVHAPLLKGHGTTPEDMARSTWKDWWESTVSGYEKLKDYGCSKIAVAGLSMGGVLALKLAQEYPVDAVVPMCAPVAIKDKRAYLAPFIHYFYPYLPRRERKKPHIEENIVPYDRTPVKSVVALKTLIHDVRKTLHRVTVPALIIQAEQDETIDPNDASFIYARIGSAQKEIKWYSDSSHIIVLDKEREQVFSDIDQFLQMIM